MAARDNLVVGGIAYRLHTASRLGGGASSRVVAGIRLHDRAPVAIKIIKLHDLSPREHQMLQNELAVLRCIRHPNIVEFYGARIENDVAYMIFERLHTDLFTLLEAHGRFDERAAVGMVRQLAAALSYLHARDICHCDLKLENAMLARDGRTVKLIDLGFSEMVSDGRLLTRLAGSLHYISPQLCAHPPQPFCGLQADCWALGVLFYALTQGMLPFYVDTVGITQRERDLELYRRIRTGVSRAMQTSLSACALEVLNGLLEPVAERRMTARQVLEHRLLA